MTNYTTREKAKLKVSTHVALAQAVAVERESLGLEPAPGLLWGGLAKRRHSPACAA